MLALDQKAQYQVEKGALERIRVSCVGGMARFLVLGRPLQPGPG